MKIISWNVNGIRSWLKKIKFQQFIKNYEPDILCLNEIKASNPINALDFYIYKYRYWNISKKKGYAGTCIFSKLEPLSVEKSPFDEEGRLLCLEFEDYYLINLYVPNSGQELKRLKYRTEKWDEELRNYIKKKDKAVIIVGDMNVAHKEIDLARPKSNLHTAGYTMEERNSFEKLLNIGLIDTYRLLHQETKDKYTYWSYRFKCREKNLGWRIDYALISNNLKDKIVKSEILENELGSDHCPILCELKI
jgi:exodeoxyribonuclease-3